MLVNPEFIAWLNRQSRLELDKAKAPPLVKRGENTQSADTKKNNDVLWGKDNENKNHEDVDYLNERPSNLNFYA